MWACSLFVSLTLWPLPWSLTHFWNFNFAYNFWTVSAKALIFHMSIPCDPTFPWFWFFLKKYLRFCIAHEHFLWQDLPTCINIFVLVTLTIFAIGHYGGHLCFTNTSFFFIKIASGSEATLDVHLSEITNLFVTRDLLNQSFLGGYFNNLWLVFDYDWSIICSLKSL